MIVARLTCLAAEGSVSAQQPVEFVKCKQTKVAQRKWEAKQRADGGLPKTSQSKVGQLSTVAKLLVVLFSTIGAALFAYRMYARHLAPQQTPAYVRLIP
jgi:hypothetical protein